MKIALALAVTGFAVVSSVAAKPDSGSRVQGYMKHLIGHTASGIEVHVELIGSDAGKQIARQPHLFSLAKEMLAELTPSAADITIEHDMHRPIGYSSVVTTTDETTVFYARLLKDDVFTRLVKNAKPEATHHLSARLISNEDGSYDLVDIWIGCLYPPKPGSPTETPESKPYWATHAVIYTDQRLEISTVTKECPYASPARSHDEKS